MTATPSAPAVLPLYRAKLQHDYIDYNGHLRDAYYGVVLSSAIDAVMDHVGLDAAYRERTHGTLYTLEIHLHYLHEVKLEDELTIDSSVLDVDHKRLHLGCRFHCPRLRDAVATGEAMLLHVRQGDTPASSPFPADIAARLAAFKLTAEARAAWGPGSRKIELTRRAAP